MIQLVIAALMIPQMHAATTTYLESGLRAESNAFYRDHEKEFDFALYVKPFLNLEKSTKHTNHIFNIAADYSKYASNSSLDYLDYNVEAKSELNKNGKWIWEPSINYYFSTEPPDEQGIDRLEKTELEPSLRLTYKRSAIKQHSLKLYAKQTTFNFDTLDYAKNNKIGASYKYQFYFLPETAFLTIVDAESSTYPNGLEVLNSDPGTTRYLYDSLLLQVRAGVQGRLTEYTTVNLLFGYANRSYEKSSSFHEPVFEVSFHEQITPQDLFMAGYIYRNLDSFYTNSELNQHMYIGYSRVFGDRLIVFLRSDYIYTSYSLPNRREDQRITGTARLDISYKPNWIIQAGVNGDILVTDVINQNPGTIIDPATSYQALQIFVGSRVSF